jgi:DNA polymerase
VTNAVKHFKHEPRGKKRLHRRPAEGEILACRPWLFSELAVSQARVIVALGSTAYFALTGERDYSDVRGSEIAMADGRRLTVTVHPAYLLRLPDAAAAERERAGFFAAFRSAAEAARILLDGSNHA